MSFPRNGNLLNGKIFVKFDHPDAGNSLKDGRLRGELKECVAISAKPKTFDFTKGKTTIKTQRKQFPMILAHAITIHKSQGDTLDYMKGDLDQTSQSGKGKAPVNPGQFYTLLSRAKSRDKIQLLNFDVSHIKVNQAALKEIERMRKESKFSWQHPLLKMSGNNKMCLFNIRSWNAHIKHFLADKVYTDNCDIFCFTETHLTHMPCNNNIENYVSGWTAIHKTTSHGLAICYNASKITIIRELETISSLEILPVAMEIENECVLLVLVYRMPGPVGNFVNDLIEELTQLSTYTAYSRTLVVGDFNMDQLLKVNEEKFNPLIEGFRLIQRSRYSTHIRGGILDLVFDDRNSESVSWIPSPYSDHFVLLI